MRVSRKLFLLVALVAILAALSVIPTIAQEQDQCEQIAGLTGGSVLVDVPDAFTTGPQPGNVLCTVLFAEEAGTPMSGAKAIPDWNAVYGVDVWTGTDPGGADFEFYDPPVRVCFLAEDFAGDIVAEEAIGPVEFADGVDGPFLAFQDARYFTTPDQIGNAYDGFSRTFSVLEPVEAGIELGYICGDISNPGAVILVPGVVASSYNPLEETTPDRCLFSGAGDCQD